jgi:hypothetical protein
MSTGDRHFELWKRSGGAKGRPADEQGLSLPHPCHTAEDIFVLLYKSIRGGVTEKMREFVSSYSRQPRFRKESVPAWILFKVSGVAPGFV